MPTTTNYGFYSPPLTGVTPNVPRDTKTLADAIDVALKAEETARIAGDATIGPQVVVPDSDAGFPTAASGATTATVVIDRYTIASAAYARVIAYSIDAYVAVSVANTQLNLVVFSDATTIGYSRINIPDALPNQMFVTCHVALPASTSTVIEARLSRNSGTGAFTSSISSSLTTSTLLLIPA